MASRKLEKMIDDLYDDDELKQAVIEDVDRRGNREKIVSGELVLPHPTDAQNWLERGKAAKAEAERQQRRQG